MQKESRISEAAEHPCHRETLDEEAVNNNLEAVPRKTDGNSKRKEMNDEVGEKTDNKSKKKTDNKVPPSKRAKRDAETKRYDATENCVEAADGNLNDDNRENVEPAVIQSKETGAKKNKSRFKSVNKDVPQAKEAPEKSKDPEPKRKETTEKAKVKAKDTKAKGKGRKAKAQETEPAKDEVDHLGHLFCQMPVKCRYV